MLKEKDLSDSLDHEAISKDVPATGPGSRPGKTGYDPKRRSILMGIQSFFIAREVAPETEAEIKAGRELNAMVHRMLLIGLGFSTAVLLAGMALSVAAHRHMPSKVAELGELYGGLKAGEPSSVLSLGILLLIATPVLRVLGSLVEFVLKKDWRFALITAAVLLILGISLIFGQR